jgi:UDP-2,3-diacylglucosamine hydrolase
MADNFSTLLNLENLNGGKKLYFASDFHLGAPDAKSSTEREKIIVQWLDEIEDTASHIFLVGDIFDFWFEYKHTIPKGFNLFLSKISQLRQKGIHIYFFTGNHDMWMFDYFPKEYGIPILRKNQIIKVGSKSILIGHGDGIGPGDHFYKFLKAFFANSICQFLFEWIHPNLGMSLAKFWSNKSRINNKNKDDEFYEEKEHILVYCKEMVKKMDFDYFIFGHRHLPLDIDITDKSKYINLGEWVNYNTFAEFDGDQMILKSFRKNDDSIIKRSFKN